MQVASLTRPVPLHGAGAPALRRQRNIIIIDESESSEEVFGSRTLRGGSTVVVEDEVEEVSKPIKSLEYSPTASGNNPVDKTNYTRTELSAFPPVVSPLGLRLERNVDACTERQTWGNSRGHKHIATRLDREEATNLNSRKGPGDLVFGAERSLTSLASGNRQDDCSSCRSYAPKRRKCSAVRDYPVGCGKNLAISQPNVEMITRKTPYESEIGATKESSERVGGHHAKQSTRFCITDRNAVCGAESSPTKRLVLEPNIVVPGFVKEMGKIIVNNYGNPDVRKRPRSVSNGKIDGEAISLRRDRSAFPRVQRADGFFTHNRSKSRNLGQMAEGQKRVIVHKMISSLLGHPRSDAALPTKKSKLLRMGTTYAHEHFVSRPSIDGSNDGVNHADFGKEPSAIEMRGGVGSRALVKQTLHDFESIRRTLVKERVRRRPDLESAKILREKGRWRNCGEKIIGEVPGVEVGDQFIFRVEMLIVGLHRQVQGGIDFIPGSRRSSGNPIATSIVASGGYEDDNDCGDTFIYTGQGGNNYSGDRRQQRDQSLVRGNLAMSNNCKEKIPVRVIRGHPDAASPTDKMYTYGGLYDVVACYLKPGLSGFAVYQFKLTRRPGQPELGSSIVNFVGKLKKKGIARPYLLLEDISEGRERLPISLVNEVDGESQPAFFIYIPDIKYPRWFSPEIPKSCDCVGGCVDEKKCDCAAKNGGEFPYNEAGYILRDKSVVFECGSSCRCSSTCYNRVSQRGIRYQLEIFKTKNRGWGVRSLNSIRSGGFICEYTGELLSDAEAESRTGSDEYLFDIGNKSNSWGDVSELMGTSASKAIVPLVEDVGYTIDAKQYGNVARFINHSCSPNLFAQNVLFDSDDLRTPHVMLFAMENIPPMRELTYDYNYSIGHVRDANGNVKTKFCFCGAADCQGRLY